MGWSCSWPFLPETCGRTQLVQGTEGDKVVTRTQATAQMFPLRYLLWLHSIIRHIMFYTADVIFRVLLDVLSVIYVS